MHSGVQKFPAGQVLRTREPTYKQPALINKTTRRVPGRMTRAHSEKSVPTRNHREPLQGETCSSESSRRLQRSPRQKRLCISSRRPPKRHLRTQHAAFLETDAAMVSVVPATGPLGGKLESADRGSMLVRGQSTSGIVNGSSSARYLFYSGRVSFKTNKSSKTNLPVRCSGCGKVGPGVKGRGASRRMRRLPGFTARRGSGSTGQAGIGSEQAGRREFREARDSTHASQHAPTCVGGLRCVDRRPSGGAGVPRRCRGPGRNISRRARLEYARERGQVGRCRARVSASGNSLFS